MESRYTRDIKPIDMTPGGYLRWLATTMDQPAVVADMLEQARRADKMLACLSQMDIERTEREGRDWLLDPLCHRVRKIIIEAEGGAE